MLSVLSYHYCEAHNLEVNLKGLSQEMDYFLKISAISFFIYSS